MHVNGYAEILSRTLLETSSLGDERTQEVARSLMAALDPALRLVALQMLTDAAEELNDELDGERVTVVMDGPALVSPLWSWAARLLSYGSPVWLFGGHARIRGGGPRPGAPGTRRTRRTRRSVPLCACRDPSSGISTPRHRRRAGP